MKIWLRLREWKAMVGGELAVDWKEIKGSKRRKRMILKKKWSETGGEMKI